MLGRKIYPRVSKLGGEKEAAVDVFVIVEFGASIPDVAQQIQKRVKEAIETMTGLKVEINIHVQGVAFESLNPRMLKVKG